MLSDREATREILTALADAGYRMIGVDYMDGEAVKVSSVEEAVAEVMAVDIAAVIVGGPTGRGWVQFVLGNGDPLDLVANFTTDLDPVIDPIMRGWGL
jgi:hypothetical protein